MMSTSKFVIKLCNLIEQQMVLNSNAVEAYLEISLSLPLMLLLQLENHENVTIIVV